MPIQDLGGDKPTDRPAPPPPPSFSPKEQDLDGDGPTIENGPDDKKVVDLDLPPPPNVPPPPPPSFSPDKEQELGSDKPADDTQDGKIVDLDVPPPPKVPPPPPPSFTPDPTPEPGPRPEPPPSDTIQDLGGDKPTPPPSFTPDPTPKPGPRPESPSDTIQDVPPLPTEDQEPRGPVIVDHVPAYDQNTGDGALGCIPTAIGSVLGYWDQKGYDNLFRAEGWDALKETKNVAEEITSTTHRNTYDPLVLNEEPSSGASIADFAQTSVSGPNDLEPMPAGWGLPSKIPEAVRGYASLKDKDYEFSAIWHEANPASSEAAWDVLTDEIDANRPLLADIDAGKARFGIGGIFGRTFDGEPDHYVPVVGYDERPDGHHYGFYATGNGSEKEDDIIWAKFESLPDFNGASGVPDAHGIEWGVAGLYTIQPDPVFVDSPPEFAPLDLTLIA